MSDVALFRAGKQPEYLKSIHEPPYAADPEAIINPDIAAVAGVPTKFWKRSGAVISEMSQAEKDAVLAAELAARKLAADKFEISLDVLMKVLVTVGNQRWATGQTITKQQFIDLVKAEIT